MVEIMDIVANASADEDKIVSDNEENSASDDDGSGGGGGVGNEKWANSIAKILKSNKPKGKKSLVLSKAKKLNERQEKSQPAGYEIATADGTIKPVTTEHTSTKDSTTEPQKKKKRKEELPKLRVKPNILERDRERTLQKIATKGVVQLFNAVRTQQKDISKQLADAGPLEVRKEKVLKNIDKRAFLDVLMGEKSENVDNVMQQKSIATNKSEEGTWNVLRDDFMMCAKMKDWDKQLEDAELEEEHANIESE